MVLETRQVRAEAIQCSLDGGRAMNFLRVGVVLVAALLQGCGGSSSSGSSDAVGSNQQITPTPQAIVTAAGTTIGPAVTTSIDASGGTLVSADGRLTITVPANAVSAATTFSIQPITAMAPTSIGASYRLEPEGVTFAVPIQLTFSVPEAGISRSSISMLGLAYQDSAGHWNWVAGQSRDTTANTVSVTTSHFSDWSTVEGYQITPMMATVKEGSTLMIEVVECVEHQALAGDLGGLLSDCHLGDPKDAVKASAWTVNGVPLGNATLGTLDPADNGQEAIYTAPAQKPTPNTVTVGARLSTEGFLPQWLAFSHISIGTPGTFQGKFTVTQQGLYAFTAKGQATVAPHMLNATQADDDLDMSRFDVTGSMRIDDGSLTMGGAPCTADVPTQTLTQDSLNLRKKPLSMLWSLSAVWNIHCQIGGESVASAVVFSWLTGCLNANTTTYSNYIPMNDANALIGDYTQACPTSANSTEVKWDFEQ